LLTPLEAPSSSAPHNAEDYAPFIDESHSIGLKILTQNIDTASAGGRLIFTVFSAIAEFEREIIRERTRAGLEAARARGRRGGRPRALSEKDLKQARALLADPDITVEEVARRLGVGPSTLYRYLPAARHAVSGAEPLWGVPPSGGA